MTRWTVAVAAAGCLGLALWSALGHPFDDDEFQHLHLAWSLWHGYLPYRDLFEHHLVFSHLLAAPLVGPAQGVWPLFALRLVGVGCLLATLWLWARVARAWDLRVPAIAGAALLVGAVPMLVLKTTEVRPAVPALLAHAACAWWLLTAGTRPWRGVVAGLFAGAMILCSQKFVYAAVGLWTAAWLVHGWRCAAAMALSATGSGAAWLLGCLAAGNLGPMWDQVVVTNLHWKRSFSPGIYLTALYRSAGPLLALAALGAIERNDRRRWALLAILAGAVLQVALVPVPFRQTFLPLFGPLLVLAALALDRLGRRLPAWAVAGLVVAGCIPGVTALADQVAPGHAEDRARMRRVDAMLPPGAPVFDGRGLVFWRPHVGHHALMHEGIQLMLDEERYAAETVAALRAAGHPLVIRDYRVEAMPQRIRDFLQEHYLPHPDDRALLVPGVQVPRSRLRRRGGTVALPVGGQWHVSWRGGGLLIDDVPVDDGTVLPLAAGEHRLQPRGPVTDLTFRLERRDD